MRGSEGIRGEPRRTEEGRKEERERRAEEDRALAWASGQCLLLDYRRLRQSSSSAFRPASRFDRGSQESSVAL